MNTITKEMHLNTVKNYIKNSRPDNPTIAITYENGNHWTTVLNDGTRLRETSEDRYLFDFAENCDVKITNYCDAGCPFCHEGSSKEGKHADLSLPIFDTWKPGTEIAIGGGNALDHPDLIPFLEKLKRQKVFCNITVNQKAVYKQYDLLKKLIDEKLVHGVGISITNPERKEEIVAALKMANYCSDVVFHVIAGIVDVKFIPILKKRKVLFLGYKDNVGRGVTFNKSHKDSIDNNIAWLHANLKRMELWTSVMSFDNLALAQLDAKNALGLPEEEWVMRFQGKDYGDPNGMNAPSTFYFDAVNQLIGRSSTQPYIERVKYTGQSYEDAFKDSLSNYTVNEDQYGELRAS